LGTSFYRGSDAVIYCANLNDKKSLDGLLDWKNQVDLNVDTNTPAILVGTKLDLLSNEEASRMTTQLQELAKFWNMQFFATSSKTGQGIEEAMAYVISEMQSK
jgi:GTPase SAR1 family protein